MRFIIINDIQLLEGIVGSLFMPLLIVFFRYSEGLNFVYSSMFAFLITWIFRKIAVNNYSEYKRKNGDEIYNYDLSI